MKAKVSYLTQPLVNLDLQGLHLIEASAGTGKTWTLSSLMVRILTEKYMPRQVIATTFTRAAAAELKSRIRKRLVEMYHQAQVWEKLSLAEHAAYQDTLKDPLEKLTFERFKDVLNEQQNFYYLVNRLRLVIESLDELFVGTIDSFTQKLLRDFSFDSGEIIPRRVTDDEKQYSYQIVHDLLRTWVQQQPQFLIDLLLFSRNLRSVDDYIATVQSTLNFGLAKLQPVACPQLDVFAIQQTLQQLMNYAESDFSTLAKFYLKDGEYHKFADKNAFVERRFVESLPELMAILREQGELTYFSHQVSGLRNDVEGLFLTQGKPRKKLLNKCSDEIQNTLYQDRVFQTLELLLQHSLDISSKLQDVDQYLRFYLSTEVKKQLPQVLSQAGETTFSQQIRTLEQSLVQGNGQLLAQAIQQRYPMILVDEFQDTNQEQDNVLRHVWRDSIRSQQGCFIAVGDPKQAIYGFRGGDILTYLNAFNDIAAKQGKFYRLEENFRSTPLLVQAVDALFLRQTDFGENIQYYQAKSGKPDMSPLCEDGESDGQPLRWVQLDESQNDGEAYFIAQKIRDLLAKAQQNKLYIDQNGQAVPILPDDIAVLAFSNRELNLVQKQLEPLQINVNRSSLTSVFESQSAQDMGAILQAIAEPDRSAILKRALLTSAIGQTLADFEQFQRNPELLNQHIQHFRHARQLWLQKGFLTAWQYLAERYQIWKTVAQRTQSNTERTIVNMRHLIELLSQHSYIYASIQHLMQWYQLQLGSPAQREWELERKLSNESGVQLMTIHKSKGLEFKIVFLMGANKEIKPKNDGLAFYEEKQGDQQPTRVIAVSKDLIADNEAAIQADQDKAAGENHRLWYVALTRASYRIYAMLHHQKSEPKLKGGADYWYTAEGQIFEHAASCIEPVERAALTYQHIAEQPPALSAQPYPKLALYPKTRTSFSRLASHLKHQQSSVDALADVVEPVTAAADETSTENLELILPVESLSTPLAWIRQNFPKGANAGNCLHEIFEDIDFQDTTHWDKVINRSLYHYGLWTPLYTAFIADYPQQSEKDLKQLLREWIVDILHTPIQQDTGLCLMGIPLEHRLVEFPFFLALADQRFDVSNIYQLFVDQGIEMPMFEMANTARYLNGAIDLMYFDGYKYHIADYKSNYLGQEQESYGLGAVEENMTQSSYWLQASIYLVALHRYLHKHLADYDIEQHLGGASYLYLRGMCGKADHAVKYWRPASNFILKLDQLLGYTQQNQNVIDAV